MSTRHTSTRIHDQLDHKVIDSDGHWREFGPIALDYLKKVAGPDIARRWGRISFFGDASTSGDALQDRLHKRIGQPPWWNFSTKLPIDTATSVVPKLMHERLPEMGLDFAVLYPTLMQLMSPYVSDTELRHAAVRAFNTYAAENWRPYADRCTAVGVIPMWTPEEAVAELKHCKELGIKAVVLGSLIRREIPALAGKDISRRYSVYLDVLGIDSPYNYDPVWQACVDLGYSPSFHTASENYGLRNSPSNYVFNHIGHFGEAGHAVAKALFIGGVTRRFPQLKFTFLEGGAAWASTLFADLVGHWEKRNARSIKDLDPSGFKLTELREYLSKYGGSAYTDRFDEWAQELRTFLANAPTEKDDFAAAQIKGKRDLYELFAQRYYFGVEADDPTAGFAFADRINPFGAKLKAVLASDISHWDVPDMSKVLAEAWEQVEEHDMSMEDFKAFTFGNPAELWTSMNPDFFTGTEIEHDVAAHLASKQATAKAA